jgi:hypothetical protein
MVFIASCSKKDNTVPEPAAGSNFKFASLTPTDTLVKVNSYITITANATGDGLAYKWTASYGTFVGSGSTVQWTVCHKAKFTITCEITDQYDHTDTKTIAVRSYN